MTASRKYFSFFATAAQQQADELAAQGITRAQRKAELRDERRERRLAIRDRKRAKRERRRERARQQRERRRSRRDRRRPAPVDD